MREKFIIAIATNFISSKDSDEDLIMHSKGDRIYNL